MASINKNKLLTKGRLTKTFKTLDKVKIQINLEDNNGSISIKEVKLLLSGLNLEKKVWEELLDEVDINKDGKI